MYTVYIEKCWRVKLKCKRKITKNKNKKVLNFEKKIKLKYKNGYLGEWNLENFYFIKFCFCKDHTVLLFLKSLLHFETKSSYKIM